MANPWSLLFPLALVHIALIVNTPAAAAAPTYLDSICSNQTTFEPYSWYEINLKRLFLTLVSNAATTANNFYSTVAGDREHDSVYGFFLCRGDLNSTACKDCVEAATLDLHQSYCSLRKLAVIWYSECLVRYSNKPLFGRLEETPKLVISSSHNITWDQKHFTQFFGFMMNDLALKTASKESGKKNSMKKVHFASSKALYMYMQCTPDLTASDCSSCLKNAITLLEARTSGRVLNPSCNVWYETSLSNFQSLPLELVTSTDMSATRKDQLLIKVVVVTVLPIASISIALFALCVVIRKANKYHILDENGEDMLKMESFRYDLASLQSATNNFSDDSKVAEGFYGCIYKGKLSTGREVFIKKLSTRYGQNEQGFKDEVLSQVKLQHRNLIEFVGFCLDGDERLVIHEVIPNPSLHYFLIEPERRRKLDWATRYHIIRGIARGMMYLDQDSWVRIIHSDIRPGNILLDADMNAKISHFGLAVNNTHKNELNRNIETFHGSFGYMSTAETMHREFAVKSNVHCFGVLLLSIISSLRYSKLTNFYQRNFAESLLSQAWEKWREGTPLDFVDPMLTDPCFSNEVLRCMHIGLLCFQGSPDDRPTMASVVFMLHRSMVTLQPPAEPAFFFLSETKPSTSMCRQEANAMPCTINTASISELQPR